MKYYIVAGEASGDLHGANLIKRLHQIDKEATVRCWGGDLMQQSGAHLVKHYRELAFMGFVEVLLNLRTIFANIRFCKQDVAAFKPHVLVLIDYPGFNLRIAKWAKKQGIKVVYYISPQIWAWKQNRGYALKRDVVEMLCILPFEVNFYKRFNWQVRFVGHPLLDAIQGLPPAQPLSGVPADKPIIALLPGSRTQEIHAMLPVYLEVAKRFPNYSFVIAGAPSRSQSFYAPFLGAPNIYLVLNQTYNLLQQAKAALVTSGTATLETALFGVPEVVCYKGSAVSYAIAKRLIKVKYISLVNLVMDREVVVELIQKNFTANDASDALQDVLKPETAARLQKHYAELRNKLGGEGASERAAKIITDTAR